MVKNQSLDDLVKQAAIQFADQIKKAAEFAEKEEEIRIEAERALAVIQKETGIILRGRQEYTIGTGRIDSVYGCVIIEYKNPHSPADRLSSNIDANGNQKVIEQIKKRFSDFKAELHMPLDTMFGVGCDGNYFIFVRCRDDKWFVEEPAAVSRYSAERFLWALINMGTKGKAFSPEYLAGDFGSESPLSHEGVKALYTTICSTSSSKAEVFFQQWKILFGEVCGYDVNSPSDKMKQLAEFYGVEGKVKTAELLFSIHTYYSIFIKLLASEIVAFFHKLQTPLQKILKAPTSNKLKDEMEDLERGSIFYHLNITNFLEGDIFAWYPDAWNDSIEKLIRDMANRLDGNNPGTLSENPAGSRDLLKKLYQQLFPKGVRHDLGEYYTPDWLAEYVLNELEYDGNPDKRLLDPACGSGTFLVMAINKIRKWYDEHRDDCGFDEGGLAKRILNNIVGFDLNPLAVMAARTNYLIAMKDLIGRVERVEIPVYLCDSILTPSEYGGLDAWEDGNRIKTKGLKTSGALFKIPLEIAMERESIAKYAEQLEFCIRNSYDSKEFIQRCKDVGLSVTAHNLHVQLYNELVKLDKANKNGVWARIIKNAFAPLFCGRFDYIAGNPPWVNWENLPSDYRQTLIPLNEYDYKLFPHIGTHARHGSTKIDISSLMAYVSSDKYLINLGKLGFLITLTIFKTEGAGQGFRKFNIAGKCPLHIESVTDFSEFQPFEGATNRTASFVWIKGKTTIYPVKYKKWIPKHTPLNITSDLSFQEVQHKFNIAELEAHPSSEAITSSWTTLESGFDQILKNAKGESYYQAKPGTCTWLNGVYWIKILKPIDSKTALIQNLGEIGKKKEKLYTAKVETDLVYSLLRGRDVKKWSATPSNSILLPHSEKKPGTGIDTRIMKKDYPLSYEYFSKFKTELLDRSGYKKYLGISGRPFYSIYNIGYYTFSKYKVVWREQATFLTSAVVGKIQNKPVIPDHKLMFISAVSEEEAHFICAFLNSTIASILIKGYIIETQTSTHVLKHLNIPKFDKTNENHIKLTKLSIDCHAAVSKGDTKKVTELEKEIDILTAKLWDIKDESLKILQKNLKEKTKSKGKKIINNSSINIELKKGKIDKIHDSIKLFQNDISPQDFLHLSHKAKYNDILNPQQRAALYKISRLKSKGYILSQKQIDYLERIIKQAIDQGLLEAKCNHHECEICAKLKDTFKK